MELFLFLLFLFIFFVRKSKPRDFNPPSRSSFDPDEPPKHLETELPHQSQDEQFKPLEIEPRHQTHGEYVVSRMISQLKAPDHQILENLLLPNSYGRTAQIDHLIISKYGIFCIETKDHRGRIFGSRYQDYWTQVFFRSRYQLYNPLKQNQSHIRALEEIIHSYRMRTPITSIVVFPFANEVHVKDVSNVVDSFDLMELIRSKNQEFYSQEEVAELRRDIETFNRIDARSHQLHRLSVSQAIEYKNAAYAS